MSQEKKFYVQRNGRTQGPFAKKKVVASIKAGSLKASDLISYSPDGPWRAIGDISHLATLLKPAIKADPLDEIDPRENDTAAETYDLYDEPTPPRRRSKVGKKQGSPRTSSVDRSAVSAKAKTSSSPPPVNNDPPADSGELYVIQNDGLLIKKRARERGPLETEVAEIFTHVLVEEDQRSTVNGKPTAWLPISSLRSVTVHGHTFKTMTGTKTNAAATLFIAIGAMFLFMGAFLALPETFKPPLELNTTMITAGFLCVVFAGVSAIPALVIWHRLAKTNLDWHVELDTKNGRQVLFPFATEEEAERSRRKLHSLLK